jgi:hypothetical protein
MGHARRISTAPLVPLRHAQLVARDGYVVAVDVSVIYALIARV